MLNFLTTVLSAKGRRIIYAVVGALGGLALIYGLANQGQVAAWTNFVSAAVALLAFVHTSWGRWATLFTNLRATVYATATALFSLLGVYGLANSDQTSAWWALLSTGLSMLALYFVPSGPEDTDPGNVGK